MVFAAQGAQAGEAHARYWILVFQASGESIISTNGGENEPCKKNSARLLKMSSDNAMS